MVSCTRASNGVVSSASVSNSVYAGATDEASPTVGGGKLGAAAVEGVYLWGRELPSGGGCGEKSDEKGGGRGEGGASEAGYCGGGESSRWCSLSVSVSVRS